MEKKYTYDAFISYRHTELDKFVAENLHKAMETFKPPKSILKTGKTSRTRIERVFRDRDELPLASNLEDPIISALKQSEYLIVICSPRLRESMWCKREIETFIAFHGRERVFAVLVEGEPEDSFPEELLYVEEEITNPDGTIEIKKKNVEPLAADVRGNSKKEVLKALKSELLRLLAPMFAVSYDDLRQRHKERRMRRIVATSVAASVVCLLIGVGSTVAALQIQRQKVQIEEQADEIKIQNDRLLENQAKSLAEKSLDMLEEGDRVGAVQTAGWALKEYEGIAMPYTPEAKYALTESLHIYDSGNIQKAQYQMETSGIIDFMSVSPDRKTVITFDRAQILNIWDIASGKLIDSLSDVDTLFNETQLTYIGGDRFAYISSDRSIHIYDISQQKISDTIAVDVVSSLASDTEGRYLATSGWRQCQVYDMATLQLLYTFEAKNKNNLNMDCYFSDDNIMIYTEEVRGKAKKDTKAGNTEEAEAEKTKLNYVNMTNGKVYASKTINYNYIADIAFVGQQVYINAHDLMSTPQNVKSSIIACSLKDGSVVWKYTLKDKLIDDMKLPELDDASNFMIYTYGEVYLLDKATGKETARFSTGSEIAGSGIFTDSGNFLILTRDGDMAVILQDGSEYLVMNYIFECKSQNVKTFKAAEGGFLVLPYNDNRITMYSVSENSDIKPYEGEALPEDSVEEEDVSSVEKAEKLGLERAALVTNILYSQDSAVIFVSYSDAILEIYNAADMTLLGTINDLKCDMTQYLGTDKEGNIYITGLSYGYCLDSSYQLTAKIEHLRKVDSENDQLIVGKDDEMFVVPIYTTEALLEKIPEDMR